MGKRMAIAKATSWQLLGLLVTTLITRLYTGDWMAAGELSGILAAVGFATYLFHERLWERLLQHRMRALNGNAVGAADARGWGYWNGFRAAGK